MKLEEFIETKLYKIERFKYFWQQQSPNDYPNDLEECDWEEQLNAYLESCDE
jgi:hypothetical protein